MTELDTVPTRLPGAGDCWNRIGVRGDRSCPELTKVVHCQNCPVFSAAGRKFLDAPTPPGYREEWTERLAEITADTPIEQQSVLVFRLAEEWLAIKVRVLVEVTQPKPIRRIPHRGGILAGLVNIRGELYLCAHLSKVLGVESKANKSLTRRMLVVRQNGDRWVLPVDEVDQVHRIPTGSVGRPPATVGRAAATHSLGVFDLDGKMVGLLDEERIFDTLRAKLR